MKKVNKYWTGNNNLVKINSFSVFGVFAMHFVALNTAIQREGQNLGHVKFISLVPMLNSVKIEGGKNLFIIVFTC